MTLMNIIPHNKENGDDIKAYYSINNSMFIIQGIVVYVVYYSVTIICILDLAKIQMLRYNIKIVCFMFSTINGFIYALQALLLDWFILKFNGFNKGEIQL
jgi:hypothetical protein